MYAYKVQILQALKLENLPKRKTFAIEVLDHINNAPNQLENVIFREKSTFHIPRTVSRHKVRIWDLEQPYVVPENVKDSDKINEWCGLIRDRIIGTFFFTERTVNGSNLS